MCRWCRTYFLQRGKCLDFLVDSDSLVDYDEDEEKAELSSAFLRDSDEGPLLGGGRPAGGAAKGDTRSGNGGSCSVMPEVAVAVRRFEALYTKLWLGLRAIVREAFSSHSDVLEAATEIQVVRSLAVPVSVSLSFNYMIRNRFNFSFLEALLLYYYSLVIL